MLKQAARLTRPSREYTETKKRKCSGKGMEERGQWRGRPRTSKGRSRTRSAEMVDRVARGAAA